MGVTIAAGVPTNQHYNHFGDVTVHGIRDWSFAVLDNFIVFRRYGKGTI